MRHVAHLGEMRNKYTVSDGQLAGKFGDLGKIDDNINKVCLKEIRCEVY
jgi:hypothetical protein